MAGDQPRGHHLLPRLYQRGFVNDRDQIRVIELPDGREYTTHIDNVAQRRDWNAFKDENGELRQDVEKILGDAVDSPAGDAFHKLRNGDFPFQREADRVAIAYFVAAQLTRGVLPRDNTERFLGETMQRSIAVAAQSAPDEWWLQVTGEVPSPEMRRKLAAGDGFEVRPTRANVLQTLLAPVDEVAEVVSMRSWSLVIFDEPSLFTSEDPVILTVAHRGPVGVGTADEVILPVTPNSALLMFRPDRQPDDRLLSGNRAFASRLNTWHLGRTVARRLLAHPDVSAYALDATADSAPSAILKTLRG